MSIYHIPLVKSPNQSLSFNLGNQNIGITLNTRLNGDLYISVSADGENITNNRICRNKVRLINAEYMPINGDLAFIDVIGDEDPRWEALNERFFLVWSDKE